MLPTTLAVALSFTLAPEQVRFLKWEREIAGIEKKLAAEKPAKGGILFAGSSTIRLWKLDANFPDWHAINTGFGGSEIRDVTHFAKRLIVPHAPQTIVFYAGDNDIGARRTPTQVHDDFRAFAKSIHAALPKTRILFIAVKPSIKRWSLYSTQQQANAMVRKLCEADERLRYIDIVPATLGTDGNPKAELFVADGLHMSEAGYAAWASVVRSAVERREP